MRRIAGNIAAQSAAIWLGFALVAWGASLLYPTLFGMLFFSPLPTADQLNQASHLWDTGHYARMFMAAECGAFYPLWPLIGRMILPADTQIEAARSLTFVSQGLFLVSVPALLAAFRASIGNARLAFLGVALFCLNPMAIFRVNGYTEALFALEAAALLGLLASAPHTRRRGLALLGIFGITALLAMTRPFTVQVVFAALAAWAVMAVLSSDRRQSLRTHLPVTLTLIAGAGAGYAIYGGFCVTRGADFFTPFTLQSEWGKRLGITPANLWSAVPLHVDLLALYYPVMLVLLAGAMIRMRPLQGMIGFRPALLLAAYPPVWAVAQAASLAIRRTRPAPRALPPWAKSHVFWFALFIALAHCLIIFFTQESLFSLSRYIFGQPFFFLSLAMLSGGLGRVNFWGGATLAAVASIYELVANWSRFTAAVWYG